MRARNPLVSVSIDTSTRRCLGCQTRNFHIPRLRGIKPAETRVDPPLQTTAFHLHPFAAALQNFEFASPSAAIQRQSQSATVLI